MTEDEVCEMDDSVFGDLDEMALPDLPDAVWMRLLANALDPDAPATGLELIPIDDAPIVADDEVPLLDDGGSELGADDLGADDGGALTGHTDDPLAGHGDLAHDPGSVFGHGDHDASWAGSTDSDSFGAHPWADPTDDHSF